MGQTVNASALLDLSICPEENCCIILLMREIMENLDYLKSSPTLQLLKQLDIPLSIASTAQKTAVQIEGILSSGAMIAVKSVTHRDWMKDAFSVAVASGASQQTWVFKAASAVKPLDALQKNLAKETVALITGWETSIETSAFNYSSTQRVLETMKQDWDPIAKAMKSAKEIWAVEADSFAKVAESWRQGIAKEITSLATTWQPIQATLGLDTAYTTSALHPLEIQNLQIAPAWTASISLEKFAPPSPVIYKTPQVQLPRNSSSRPSFSNYRMADAYDLLSDFERELRNFIHEAMSKAFCSDWEKSRVPREMYNKWREKWETAELAGESPQRLIDYADFTDYVTIISRNDNWNALFRARLGRRESVQESLYRLQPIRVCIMHARILSPKMWLVLQTETVLLSDKMWN